MKIFKLILPIFFILLILPINTFAYPSNLLIYPEKIQKISISFPYNYLFDFKINYTVDIINKNNDNRANFIGSMLSSFFDLYFKDRKIKLDENEKEKIVLFLFNNLAIYFQKQRTVNNQFAFKDTFFDELNKKDFILFKTDKKEESDYSLIKYEVSYEYDFKSSKILLNCKKVSLFDNQISEKKFSFDYKYLSFYNDFKNLFVNNLMSFFLNQKFYNLEIELNSSAYIEVDGTVTTHFVDENYPSICELVIKVFEDGYDSATQKIKMGKNERITVFLNKKINHCKLKINTFPSSASIKISNQYVGNSPLILELPSGNHFIIVSASGYESKEVFVTIEDKDFEKEIYVYLMPENTTSFYINYSNSILTQVYNYFWYGCYGLAGSIVGSILYNYFNQFNNSSLYPAQTVGLYGSAAFVAIGLITFTIFEILSLTELYKYYQFINYYTL
jgi:hypothetical protein